MELSEKEKLVYDAVLKRRNLKLNQTNDEKFKIACKRAFKENPELSLEDLVTACNIYLNFILNFPDDDLFIIPR